MGKLKAGMVNFGLLLGSLIIGVTVGEIGLRLAGIEGLQKLPEAGHSTFSPSFFTQSDPDRGWANRPGARGWWRYEGESYVEINSDGLRDREYSPKKPANTFRIALLGDSFTLASQVPLQQNYGWVLEEKLGQCPQFKGQNIEVLNFGVDGYGTAQELITLREKVWNYHPDWVILSFFVSNDVSDNSKKLENNQYRPFFVYRNGELVPDFSFRDLPLSYSNSYLITTVDRLPAWLVNHSRILQVAKKAELESRKRNLLNHFNQLSANSFREPTEPVWKEAWQITEALVTLINQEVKAKNSQFLLVIIGDPMQVHLDEVARQDFIKKNQIQDFFYPNKRLKALGEQQKFPVLDLAEPFQTYGKTQQVCLHGFENSVPCGGHWNREGHRLAAELIAQKFCETTVKQR